MAKYSCPYCGGFAHTSGGIPNHLEWLLTSAVQWNAMPETVQSGDLYLNSHKLYRCVSCKAIAVFWDGLSTGPTWYQPHE
jgi:DNA-directed RNA polymerase subunit RPC12/RpoP